MSGIPWWAWLVVAAGFPLGVIGYLAWSAKHAPLDTDCIPPRGDIPAGEGVPWRWPVSDERTYGAEKEKPS